MLRYSHATGDILSKAKEAIQVRALESMAELNDTAKIEVIDGE